MANLRAASGLVCVAAGMLAMVPVVALAEDSQDDWQWALTIYGWLPSMSGDTSFPSSSGGGGSSIDVDGSDILDSLKFTFMGMLDVRKGRWGLATDVNYLDLGDSKSRTRALSIGGNDLPASVTAKADYDLSGWVWSTVGTYRVVDQPGNSFDLLAGARLLDLSQTLKWRFDGDLGSLPLPERAGRSEVSDSLWDGIVGVMGRVSFGAGRAWFAPYYLDIGTGNSDFTMQAMAGVGYAFDWGNLTGVWRYLDYDLGSNSPIQSLTLSGPAIGATFRF
jgi:hypothetical protein